MRTIDPGLAAHLAGDATTLCHCWRVTRTDGKVLGFTDHDRDLSLGGTLYQAGSGFAGGAMGEEAGLPAGSSDVEGAFSSALITETDLEAGRFDGARVEVFAVDFTDTTRSMLLKVQDIGEVTMAGDTFRAELRPFTHRLQQVTGRIYSRSCGATLGDADCGLALVEGVHTGRSTVLEVLSATRLRLSGLSAFAAGTFDGGRLAFTGGVLAGLGADMAHAVAEQAGSPSASAALVVDLWLPLAVLPQAGDPVIATAGCPRSFTACRDRFGNQLNFRGFPHLPGADFAYSYADRDSTHDGRPLF